MACHVTFRFSSSAIPYHCMVASSKIYQLVFRGLATCGNAFACSGYCVRTHHFVRLSRVDDLLRHFEPDWNVAFNSILLSLSVSTSLQVAGCGSGVDKRRLCEMNVIRFFLWKWYYVTRLGCSWPIHEWLGDEISSRHFRWNCVTEGTPSQITRMRRFPLLIDN